MDIWVVYPYSLDFSDQLSCIKFFHRSYRLKDIDFQSLIQIKKDFWICFNYPEADMWVPAVRLTRSTVTILDNVDLINKEIPEIV